MAEYDDRDLVFRHEDKGFESEASRLGSFLKKLRYPLTRTKILSEASKHKLADESVQFLKRMTNRAFESAGDVMADITGDSSIVTMDSSEEPSQ